jgi:lysozyme
MVGAMTELHLSDAGAGFIGDFEGFSSKWYKDPVGVETIGYGHTGPLPAGFKAPLTRAQARKLLIHDAEKVAVVVRQIRPRVTRQSRFDALVSFGYNLGPGYFLDKRTSIGKALALPPARRVKEVAFAILLYDHAGGKVLPGLLRRRKAESRLWASGQYR